MAQITVSASKDAMMGKKPNGDSGWNGKDNHLPIGRTRQDEWKIRCVIDFNIDFTPMYSITSAYLRLHNNADAGSSNLHCRQQAGYQTTLETGQMYKDWSELNGSPDNEGATDYATFSTGLSYGWDNRSEAYWWWGSSTSYGPFTQPKENSSGSSYIDINVTPIVSNWLAGDAQYGIMVYNTEESNTTTGKYKAVQFYSKSATNTSVRPTLVIDYVPNTSPYAPTLTSPVNGAVINELTPTLSGIANDPDTGDYITAVSPFVHRASNRYNFLYNPANMNDPGSGNLKCALVGGVPTLVISKTDADGKQLSIGDVARSIRLDNIATGNYNMLGRWTGGSETSSYSTLTYTSSLSSLSGLTSNQEVYIFPESADMWSPGSITISGAPTSFSILYGSSGSWVEPITTGRTYKWRATTADKALAFSPLSSFAYFKTNSVPNAPTVTILSTPVLDITTLTPSINITHSDPDTSDSNMYAYDIVIEKEISPGSDTWSTDGGLLTGTVSITPATSYTYTVGIVLSPGSTYRIKAKTRDSSGSFGPYSEWQKFAIHKTSTPTITYPSNNIKTSLTPTFQASKPATSADIINAYYIYAETVPAGVSPVISNYYSTGITNSSSFSIVSPVTLTISQSYRWRAKLGSSASGYSDFSDWAYFSIPDEASPYIAAPQGSGYTLTPTITITRSSAKPGFSKAVYQIFPETASEAVLGTPIYTSSELTVSPTAYTYNTTYGGSPALAWSTAYQVRASVYETTNGWSPYSGLTTFTTAFASAPTLGNVNGAAYSTNPWITGTQPSFTMTSSNTIDLAQVQVLDIDDSSVVWDSGLTDVANSTSATVAVSGLSNLTRGKTYSWRARYKDTTAGGGKMSEYQSSLPYNFKVNSVPNTPSNMSPAESGSTVVIPSTLFPTFQAKFEDNDVNDKGDYPSSWYIIIEAGGPSWSTAYTKNVTLPSSTATPYSYTWTSSDYAFAYDNTYQWKTYFKDSKGEVGAYSQSFPFIMSVSPTAYLTFPSPGTAPQIPSISQNITSKLPTITWSITGTQQYAVLTIEETDKTGVVISGTNTNAYPTRSITVYSSSQSYVFTDPSYFADGKYFKLTLDIYNNAGLKSADSSVAYFKIALTAPPAITGLTKDVSSGIYVQLDWTKDSVTADDKFVAYRIQRKLVGDLAWQTIKYIYNKNTLSYQDYLAGNTINYQYMITQLATTGTSGAELESPIDSNGGSVVTAKIDEDIWSFIPYDRNPSFTQELPVIDSSYNKVIQQESFETLGSNRKTVIRGFVLGDEGSITCVWQSKDVIAPGTNAVYYNENIIGRRLLDYISTVKGPHILKSPFGDVWEVQFEGPEITWMPTGVLQATITWVETGTAQESSI